MLVAIVVDVSLVVVVGSVTELDVVSVVAVVSVVDIDEPVVVTVVTVVVVAGSLQAIPSPSLSSPMR